MMFTFTIPGEPIPKARPRVTKAGYAYTQKKTKDYEKLVQDVYRLTVGTYLGREALVCDIRLYFSIPLSYSKSKVRRIENGQIKYIKKPDVDNCAKAILDALNGIAYDDDSQIISLKVSKNYSQSPRAEVTISESV